MSQTITDENLKKIIKALKKSASKHRSDIRPGKRRFGIYKYLTDVYRVYRDLRSRRVAKKATRRISKICKLSIQKKSHPIRILIEASAGPEDARQKSRWTQALKYAFGWRQLPERLEWFFNVNGGISGCAKKYAVNKKTTLPKNDGSQNSIIHQQNALGEIPNLNTAVSPALKVQE